jgi:hypothetical protein
MNMYYVYSYECACVRARANVQLLIDFKINQQDPVSSALITGWHDCNISCDDVILIPHPSERDTVKAEYYVKNQFSKVFAAKHVITKYKTHNM